MQSCKYFGDLEKQCKRNNGQRRSLTGNQGLESVYTERVCEGVSLKMGGKLRT